MLTQATLDLTAEPAVAYHRLGATLHPGDFVKVAAGWPAPTVIVVDGPYGVGSFPGDPVSHEVLPQWYRPHVALWSERALPETTLWFWNTEIGWASVHPVLVENGWEYRSCHVWDKGVGHIAGNANSKTLRRFPVVTEVCAQYVRKVRIGANGAAVDLKEWVRSEWERSGLPLYQANAACGVKNAATRKYLTKCHLWYFPPPEAFEMLADTPTSMAAGRPAILQLGRLASGDSGRMEPDARQVPLQRRHNQRVARTGGARRGTHQERL